MVLRPGKVSPFFRFLRSLITGAILCGSLSGCHTWRKNHLTAIQHFDRGNLEQSEKHLEKSLHQIRSEKNLLALDQAIIHLASGEPAAAENGLRSVRRELDYLTQKDITEQTASMLTDDRAQAFSGRPFERQMTLNMLLLTSLMNNGQDSFAYAMQATEQSGEKKQLLAEAARKAKSADSATPAEPPHGEVIPAGFEKAGGEEKKTWEPPPIVAPTAVDQPLALSAYLSAVVNSEIPSRYQETEQAFRDVAMWNPEFAERQENSIAGEFGTRCRPGHGTLHVIVLAGHAPEWVPEVAEPTTISLLIADRILSVAGKHTLPPTIAPVKIGRPAPAVPVIPGGAVRCRVSLLEPATTHVMQSNASVSGDASTGYARLNPGSNDELQESSRSPSDVSLTFHTLVDLQQVAEAHYQQNRDQEIGRAITRRVVKKGTVYALKETQQIHNNTAVDLAVNLAGIAWEAMEQPDTRSWRLLPARIDVARMELPAGKWNTSIQVSDMLSGGSSSIASVHVDSGRNTLLVCFIPDRKLTGTVLIGGSDKGVIPVSNK
ncbi:MAG: hypothetical protein ACK50J_27815 [Planctomyces sp.]